MGSNPACPINKKRRLPTAASFFCFTAPRFEHTTPQQRGSGRRVPVARVDPAPPGHFPAGSPPGPQGAGRIPLARLKQKRSAMVITAAERFCICLTKRYSNTRPRSKGGPVFARFPGYAVAGWAGRIPLARLKQKRSAMVTTAAERFCICLTKRDLNTRPRRKGGPVFARFPGYAVAGWAGRIPLARLKQSRKERKFCDCRSLFFIIYCSGN